MIQQDSLARLTLDTLPFNIAVLDEEGTILFTNRAWREFAGMGGERGEMVGTNYFESMDVSSDEDAARALAGLEAVIAGEQDVFTLEYPCHSEAEKHWFLMRAAALPDHETGSVVVAHIDITQRKLAELRARDQRRELEHLMSRIDGLVHTVTEAVLQANTREEIERAVCERLADVDAYTGAWVGRVDLRTETLVPAAVGNGLALPESATADLAGPDPAARAVRTGDLQVGEPRDAGGDGEGENGLAAVHGDALPAGGALAAFPLTYGDTEYGVLVVYADSPNVFDERELAVLQVLAQFASTAINAIEGRRILATDRVIEMELSLAAEELFFGEVARQLDCTLGYEGTLYEDDGSVVMLFVAEDVDPERVVEVAAGAAGVRSASHVSDGESGGVFEFAVDSPPVVSALAERGAETTDITASPAGVEVTLELPASADPRTVVEHLGERYPSTELLARREHERPEQTKQDLVTDIEESLTARQELALRKAYLGGFFDWPRDVSGEELAASMDISPSTYHQHLRTAERKVLAAVFEE
jgi:PAS domain S-box-containing protein